MVTPVDSIVQPNVEVCRLLTPNDANIYGKVHGGTTLQLIEEAGYIVCYKHCNKDTTSTEKITPLLCRIERTRFILPLDLAELAIVKAAIDFTTEKTLRVEVNVYTDNFVTGQRQLKCTSILWYCGTVMDTNSKAIIPVPVPQVLCTDSNKEQSIRDCVLKNKHLREKFGEFEKKLFESLSAESIRLFFSSTKNDNDLTRYTVSASKTVMYHLVTPIECTNTGILTGGSLLKRMDECGAIAAVKHCRSPVVTGCLEAVDFHAPTNQGALLLLVARVVFTSKRTIEVDVVAIEEDPVSEIGNQRLICSSFFTYVAISNPTKPVKDVPPLILESDYDKERFSEAQKRYIERKNSF